MAQGQRQIDTGPPNRTPQLESETIMSDKTNTTPGEAAQIVKTFLLEVQESHVWEAIQDAMEKKLADPGDVFFAGLNALINAEEEDKKRIEDHA
jgi:hypothetical protein